MNISHDWTGYDIVGGVEYAIAPNWTARVEYRYSDFATWNRPKFAWVPSGTTKVDNNAVTFGVSYLFGGLPRRQCPPNIELRASFPGIC